MSNPALAPNASESFRKATKLLKKAKPTKPFAIRFTAEEMAFLRQKARSKPIGTYIREQMLGENLEKRRSVRRPAINQKEYATLLAALGQSRYSSNLNQISKAVNMGTLDVSEDVEQQLKEAAVAIIAMREALITALGMRS